MIMVNKQRDFFRIMTSFGRTPRLASWNHSALKQLVGDRSSNLVDENGPHLRIALKKCDDFLFFGARRSVLAFLHPQLLARRALIFLDDFVGIHVQDRVLRWGV